MPQEQCYIMSMFRTRELLPNVLTHAPMNIVRVVATRSGYTEYWYVLGVRKSAEGRMLSAYKKLAVQSHEYDKMLCMISGHVPADLLRALNSKVKNVNYLHGLCVAEPRSNTNTAAVRLIKDTSATMS